MRPGDIEGWGEGVLVERFLLLLLGVLPIQHGSQVKSFYTLTRYQTVKVGNAIKGNSGLC